MKGAGAGEGQAAVTPLSLYQHLASRSGRLAVVVLREPRRPGELLCDGLPLMATRPLRCSAPLVPIAGGDIVPSDRFIDKESWLTLSCPRGGDGVLTFDGRVLRRQRAHELHCGIPQGAMGATCMP